MPPASEGDDVELNILVDGSWRAVLRRLDRERVRRRDDATGVDVGAMRCGERATAGLKARGCTHAESRTLAAVPTGWGQT